MLIEDAILNFRGFVPTEYICTEINALVQMLLQESPSESFLRASFSRDNHSFFGAIDITSTVGTFCATAIDSQVLGLASKLKGQIVRQLEEWKRHRFSKAS